MEATLDYADVPASSSKIENSPILARVTDATRYSGHRVGTVEIGLEALGYGEPFVFEVLVASVAMLVRRRRNGE